MFNASPAGCRLAPAQVRPSKPVVAYAGLPTDKEVSRIRGTGAVVARARPVAIAAPRFEAMSIQRFINPEPIRSHRFDIRVRSILRHRAEPSGEADSQGPLDSAGSGAIPKNPQKESVTFSEVFELPTPARHWSKEFVPSWQCHVRGAWPHQCWCLSLVGVPLGPQKIGFWLRAQGSRGHDYLELSGGMLSS
jgi:hypothetical protein